MLFKFCQNKLYMYPEIPKFLKLELGLIWDLSKITIVPNSIPIAVQVK